MPTARLNGIDIHYEVTGDGPETLVLVHNVIANMSAYDDNAPAFGKHFRTIRFDLRGHGQSSKVDTQDEAPGFYTYENTAADLAALLDHLGVERCHVLGQAYWGVSTASTFMARHPRARAEPDRGQLRPAGHRGRAGPVRQADAGTARRLRAPARGGTQRGHAGRVRGAQADAHLLGRSADGEPGHPGALPADVRRPPRR